MSRTACCFLALGISVTFAAACGDDDVDFNGIGGSGGRAGSGGAAGSPGNGGSGGDAGSPGNGGTGGSAGSPGNGGTGGSAGSPGNGGTGGSAGSPGNGGTGGSAGSPGNGGTGGSAGTGGTGGSDLPDGGTDASIPPVDGGVGEGSGPCPNFVTAADDIVPQGGQEIVIARVVFNGDGSADVVLRNPLEAIPGDAGATNFPLIEPRHICSGANNCELLEEVCDDEDINILSGEEVTCTISDTVIAEGEIGILSNTADVGAAFIFAYVQWDVDDNFVSAAPTVGGGDNLEVRAIASGTGFWEPDQTIAVDADDNAIVATGDTVVAADFESCELP